MIRFILRRIAESLLTLVAITFIVFTLTFAMGDPVSSLLPPSATKDDRERLRRDLNLDRPLPVQFMMFAGRAVRGDFGHSYYHGRPVTELIRERAPATVELAVVSMILSMLIGIPLGIFAAVRPRSWLTRFSMWLSLGGISLPTFWLGLLLMMFFGVQLGWLPPSQRGDTRTLFGADWSVLTADGRRHIILPAATLALHHVAMMIRLTRSELSDTLRMPFIRVARAYGLPERSVIGRHAMRNTLIPILTVSGVEFGQLIAFSVVTETIFQWPGLGKLLIDSIQVDRPLVVCYVMMTGVIFLGINLVIDLLYAVIDPRIRVSGGEGAA